MSWFKKEEAKSDTEVCGFLNVKGQFFESKEKRDESNKKIKFKETCREICSEFDNILRSYPPRDYYNLFSYDSIPDEAKLRLLELVGKYLKLKE